MLAEPAPQSDLPIANAMWRLGRSKAFAARGELEEAKFEQATFVSIVKSFYPGTSFRKNDARFMFQIAGAALAGGILYREKKVDEAVYQLREAVRGEDSLHYMEPPDWIEPNRHILGAVLMDAAVTPRPKPSTAKTSRHPENGWSLFGLCESLRKQKKETEAAAVAARFKAAWKDADVQLTASHFGLPSANTNRGGHGGGQ